MPFYEYQCQACHSQHEVLQKISDPPLKTCPQCRKPKLKKLVSAPVFRLKGSGWYETDFKSDQETKRNLVGAEADGAPAADTAKPDNTKETAASASGTSQDTGSASADKAGSTATAQPNSGGTQPASGPKAVKRAPARKSSAGKTAGKKPSKRPGKK